MTEHECFTQLMECYGSIPMQELDPKFLLQLATARYFAVCVLGELPSCGAKLRDHRSSRCRAVFHSREITESGSKVGQTIIGSINASELCLSKDDRSAASQSPNSRVLFVSGSCDCSKRVRQTALRECDICSARVLCGDHGGIGRMGRHRLNDAGKSSCPTGNRPCLTIWVMCRTSANDSRGIDDRDSPEYGLANPDGGNPS